MSSVDLEFGLTCLAAMLSPTTLTFTVLALVLSRRPKRTGAWFFTGAFGTTMVIGIVAAFVLGDAAAPHSSSGSTRTWVAIFDVVAGCLLLLYALRLLRRPRDPKQENAAIDKMNKVASSPAIAIVAAGATLANPGAFIPIALKEISQLKPGAAGYVAIWIGFALVSLLPLVASLIALAVSPEWTTATLQRARDWLQRHAKTVAAILIALLAAALLRNGITALT